MGKSRKSTQYKRNVAGLIGTAFTMFAFIGDMTFVPMFKTVRFWIDPKTGAVTLRDSVKGEVQDPSAYEFYCNKLRANGVKSAIAREPNRADGGGSAISGKAIGFSRRDAVEGIPVWRIDAPRYTAAEVIDILTSSTEEDYKEFGVVKETHEQKVARGELIKDALANGLVAVS